MGHLFSIMTDDVALVDADDWFYRLVTVFSLRPRYYRVLGNELEELTRLPDGVTVVLGKTASHRSLSIAAGTLKNVRSFLNRKLVTRAPRAAWIVTRHPSLKHGVANHAVLLHASEVRCSPLEAIDRARP